MRRRYSIIKSHREGGKVTETVVKSGLAWEVADMMRDRLQEQERDDKPMQSCWTRDVYYCRLKADDNAL